MDKIQELLQNFIQNKRTVATAESCTGGLIAKTITDYPGVSSCYNMGFITYSNEAKMQCLGVSSETLSRYGAVSEQTACEMAQGARGTANADYAIATTGIAGPGGGEAKPVGLVYIAVASSEETICQKHIFAGAREEIRQQAAVSAFEMLGAAMQKYI